MARIWSQLQNNIFDFAVVEVHNPDNGYGTAILKMSIPYIDIYSEAVNEKVVDLVAAVIEEVQL